MLSIKDKVYNMKANKNILHFVLNLFNLYAFFFRPQITACFSTYFEVRACRPHLDKLKRLLKVNPYSGPEHEVTDDDDVIVRPPKVRLYANNTSIIIMLVLPMMSIKIATILCVPN